MSWVVQSSIKFIFFVADYKIGKYKGKSLFIGSYLLINWNLKTGLKVTGHNKRKYLQNYVLKGITTRIYLRFSF